MMNKHFSRRRMLSLTAKAAALGVFAPRVSFGKNSPGKPQHGAVACEPNVAEVGRQMLAAGGNAVDAAVAAAFAAGILWASKCGLGGYGGAMIIGLANGKVRCIDFNMTAPSAARADMFALDANGKAIGKKNFHGWLAAGVPGTCAGLQLALERYGTRSLREVLQPAIALANKPPKPDRYVKFPVLAKTLSTLAERNSVESFYRGDLAQEIADAFKKNDGLITAKDLASFQAREVAPHQIEWKGNTIFTPPLCATGLLVLEMISVLKALNWDKLPESPAKAHARLEALRLCWKDRVDYFGDPQFVDVPVTKLLSAEQARSHAALVEKAVKEKKAMSLKLDRIESTGTMNISTVDARGNFAAMTLTQGNGWGAGVMVESLGVLLGNGMARFDPRPGRANSIAPGKRPLTNMMPCVLTKNGKPFLAVGAAGGTKIPNAIFDFLCRYIAGGDSIEQALARPRLNCVGTTNVSLEKGWPTEEAQYFKQAGFKINEAVGAVVGAVELDSRTHQYRDAFRTGNPFQ